MSDREPFHKGENYRVEKALTREVFDPSYSPDGSAGGSTARNQVIEIPPGVLVRCLNFFNVNGLALLEIFMSDESSLEPFLNKYEGMRFVATTRKRNHFSPVQRV